jgi:hypothetical protein
MNQSEVGLPTVSQQDALSPLNIMNIQIALRNRRKPFKNVSISSRKWYFFNCERPARPVNLHKMSHAKSAICINDSDALRSFLASRMLFGPWRTNRENDKKNSLLYLMFGPKRRRRSEKRQTRTMLKCDIYHNSHLNVFFRHFFLLYVEYEALCYHFVSHVIIAVALELCSSVVRGSAVWPQVRFGKRSADSLAGY